MIDLRVSVAAALAIIEQADYFRQTADISLAERWESAVDQGGRSLMNMPDRGALCQFRRPALAGLRWVFVPRFPKHMIFYRYSSPGEVLVVIHMLHGARNLEALLDEEWWGAVQFNLVLAESS